MSDVHRMSLLLPDALHEKLKAIAAGQRRSIHAQILWYLERSLHEDDAVEQAVLRNPEVMAAIRHAREGSYDELRRRELRSWPEECGPE